MYENVIDRPNAEVYLDNIYSHCTVAPPLSHNILLSIFLTCSAFTRLILQLLCSTTIDNLNVPKQPQQNIVTKQMRHAVQCSCSGYPTGYGKKLSRIQAQLGQATCLAVA